MGVDLIFADPNMAMDALWRSGGVGAGIPVRVIRRAPDEVSSFSAGRFVSDTVLISVRVADAPTLKPGDTFEIGGELFEVRSEPLRDSDRLVWSCEAFLA